MKQVVKSIPFYDGELLGIKDESGHVWLGVKKACLDIGLNEKQAANEVRKVQKNTLFHGNYRKLKIVQKEGNKEIKREVVVIAEKLVPLWLAQINLTPNVRKNNPAAVEKLLQYQLAATDVLHNAFMVTEEQKEKLYSALGLEGEIHDLLEAVKSLKTSVQELIDHSTINTAQQNALFNLAKERICDLLGGKKSLAYQQYSKLYFKNLWGEVKRCFNCSGSYKNLNPKDYKPTKEFIRNWNYSG